jgi:hypothetical protein
MLEGQERGVVDCNCRRIEPFTVPLYRLDDSQKDDQP